MKANETQFRSIIGSDTQYQVPLFQRAYCWKKENWKALWNDLMGLYEDKNITNHFIGSIVTEQYQFHDVAKFLLIDGQQRLTTIFILLALLRDVAKKKEMNDLADEIQDTMVNRHKKQGDDYYKLLSTQDDFESFKSLVEGKMEGKPISTTSNLIEQCYNFFEKIDTNKISSLDIKKMYQVITERLSIVRIELGRDDNSYRIFESLNGKGQPLSPSDLIRNYFFMKIKKDREKHHTTYWKPMEKKLGEENLTKYIHHYLIQKEERVVNLGDVYTIFKICIEKNDALTMLEEIAKFATYYEKFLKPEKESQSQIKKALVRLKRLDITTTYPFLLKCYHDYDEKRISADDLEKILQTIENYLIRRFVCNILTKDLNKIIPSLYKKVKENDDQKKGFVEGVRTILQKENYPKDSEFREKLMNSELYRRKKETIEFILENLESAYEHKEAVDFEKLKLTIEHIMPQKLTDEWKNQLGEDYQRIHDSYLHLLGNLTLTGYNSELSNKSFPEKKKRLAESHLELNRYFQSIDVWNEVAIKARSKVLAELALSVWPSFGEAEDSQNKHEDVTGKKPKAVTIFGQQKSVHTWRDVLYHTLNTIAELAELDPNPKSFTQFASEYPSYINSDSRKFSQRFDKLDNGYFFNINLSSKYIYHFCLKAIEFIGGSNEDWEVEYK